jgi:hypothetical protein
MCLPLCQYSSEEWVRDQAVGRAIDALAAAPQGRPRWASTRRQSGSMGSPATVRRRIGRPASMYRRGSAASVYRRGRPVTVHCG